MTDALILFTLFFVLVALFALGWMLGRMLRVEAEQQAQEQSVEVDDRARETVVEASIYNELTKHLMKANGITPAEMMDAAERLTTSALAEGWWADHDERRRRCRAEFEFMMTNSPSNTTVN